MKLLTFDVETTGTNKKTDRIVQIAWEVYDLYAKRVLSEQSFLVNPLRDIPAEATAKHGITQDRVADQPTFHQLRTSGVFSELESPDVVRAGYNVKRFDIEMIEEAYLMSGNPIRWGGPVLDGFALWQALYPRTLQDAYKKWVDEQGFEGAHDALVDVRATRQVLEGMLQKEERLGSMTPQQIHDLCFPPVLNAIDSEAKLIWNADGKAIWTIGKMKGVPLAASDAGFLNWVLKNDFKDDLKQLVREAKAGRYPTRA